MGEREGGWEEGGKEEVTEGRRRERTNLSDTCSLCHMVRQTGKANLVEFHQFLQVVVVIVGFHHKWNSL